VRGNEQARTWRRATTRTLAAIGVAALFLLLPAGPAAGQPEPAPDLQPFLSCVTANQDGTVTARFGYVNGTGASLSIPPGEGNSIDPGTYLDHLPSEFAPGRTEQAFTVTFPGPDVVVWNLNGSTSTASAGSAPCPAEPPGPPATGSGTGPGTAGESPAPTSPAPVTSRTSTTAADAVGPALPPTAPSAPSGAAPAQASTPAPVPRGSGVRGTSVSAPAPASRARPARAVASAPPSQGIASLDRSNAVPAITAGLILLAIASAGVAAGRHRPRH